MESKVWPTRGPLLWRIAIYAISTTCLTKMAKDLPQQKHLQLGLCLFLHFTTTLNPLLLLLLYFYLSIHILLFCFTLSLSYSCLFSHSPWTVPLTSSNFPWPKVPGKDAMNGLFSCFSFSHVKDFWVLHVSCFASQKEKNKYYLKGEFLFLYMLFCCGILITIMGIE